MSGNTRSNSILEISKFNTIFYKWCNCERTHTDIAVKCYDYPLEAIAENDREITKPNYDWRCKEIILIPIFKYMPVFMQKKIIQNYFKRPVEFYL